MNLLLLKLKIDKERIKIKSYLSGYIYGYILNMVLYLLNVKDTCGTMVMSTIAALQKIFDRIPSLSLPPVPFLRVVRSYRCHLEERDPQFETMVGRTTFIRRSPN